MNYRAADTIPALILEALAEVGRATINAIAARNREDGRAPGERQLHLLKPSPTDGRLRSID